MKTASSTTRKAMMKSTTTTLWRPSGAVTKKKPLEMPIAPRMAPAPVSSGISTHDLPHDSFEQIRRTCEHYEAKCSGKYQNHVAASRYLKGLVDDIQALVGPLEKEYLAMKREHRSEPNRIIAEWSKCFGPDSGFYASDDPDSILAMSPQAIRDRLEAQTAELRQLRVETSELRYKSAHELSRLQDQVDTYAAAARAAAQQEVSQREESVTILRKAHEKEIEDLKAQMQKVKTQHEARERALREEVEISKATSNQQSSHYQEQLHELTTRILGAEKKLAEGEAKESRRTPSYTEGGGQERHYQRYSHGQVIAPNPPSVAPGIPPSPPPQPRSSPPPAPTVLPTANLQTAEGSKDGRPPRPTPGTRKGRGPYVGGGAAAVTEQMASHIAAAGMSSNTSVALEAPSSSEEMAYIRQRLRELEEVHGVMRLAFLGIERAGQWDPSIGGMDVDFQVVNPKDNERAARRRWYGPPAQPSTRLNAQFYKDSSLLEGAPDLATGGNPVFQRVSRTRLPHGKKDHISALLTGAYANHGPQTEEKALQTVVDEEIDEGEVVYPAS